MSSQASTKYEGVFKPGEIGIVMLTITDFEGNPQNPSSISIDINNESTGLLVESGIPEQIKDGYYIYEWEISSSQDIGNYTVTWEYDWDSTTYTEEQTVVVTEDTTNVGAYSEEALAMIRATEGYLMCPQHIPVYFEQARPTENYNTYRFTFGNWNQNPRTIIYRNKQILTGGYEIDYFNGTVTFEDDLTEYDAIYADYNFRWFTENDLYTFLQNSLKEINVAPPFQKWTLKDLAYNIEAAQYSAGVIYGAIKDAIRTFLMCLQFQQPQEVFGGPERANSAFNNMNSLKENYEASFNRIIENKKFGKYPRIGIISIPEYTLPGGRSRWFRMLYK